MMMSSSSSPATVDNVHPGYMFLIMYTIVGAFGFGMSMFFPDYTVSFIHPEWSNHIKIYDVWYRCLGSLWLSLSIASMMAVKAPLRMSPIYVCQMIYKSIWIITTCLPRLIISGDLLFMDGFCAFLMTSFIVMDYMFLPWDYILYGNIPSNKKPSSIKKV